MDMKKIRQKVGHDSQLYGAEVHRLCGGKADGMRIVQMRSGKGLTATVAADRGMDLARLEYRGINLGYFSPVGYVGPQYYDEDEFLRSFTAGFFTTCGLKNVGSGCEDDGEKCVVHGRIGNQPAERLLVETDYSGNQPAVTVKGVINEAVIFGEKLQLHRTYALDTDANTLTVSDRVENLGGEAQPLMLLYHMNMGYPLLDEGGELMLPALKTVPRDARAAEGIAEWKQISAPISGFAEQCYYHTMAGKDGKSLYGYYNPSLHIGIAVRYSVDALPCFTQWKMPGVRDYVLGLEPGNCRVEGRAKMRADGDLQFIGAGESREFSLKIRILDGDTDAAAVRNEITALLHGAE